MTNDLLPDLHAHRVDADGVDFDALRTRHATGAPGDRAVLAAIDCLAMACRVSLDEGLTREREIFLQLMGSPESQALRQAFFARRQQHGS